MSDGKTLSLREVTAPELPKFPGRNTLTHIAKTWEKSVVIIVQSNNLWRAMNGKSTALADLWINEPIPTSLPADRPHHEAREGPHTCRKGA